MTLYCPHCGQRVLLRLGVHLSPRRADVFDAIARQSKYGGIRADALAAMFGKLTLVRVHINHINKLLAPNGWQIVCEREGCAMGFYRIKKRRGNHDGNRGAKLHAEGQKSHGKGTGAELPNLWRADRRALRDEERQAG